MCLWLPSRLNRRHPAVIISSLSAMEITCRPWCYNSRKACIGWPVAQWCNLSTLRGALDPSA